MSGVLTPAQQLHERYIQLALIDMGAASDAASRRVYRDAVVRLVKQREPQVQVLLDREREGKVRAIAAATRQRLVPAPDAATLRRAKRMIEARS